MGSDNSIQSTGLRLDSSLPATKNESVPYITSRGIWANMGRGLHHRFQFTIMPYLLDNH
jgi:hypothetical protein